MSRDETRAECIAKGPGKAPPIQLTMKRIVKQLSLSLSILTLLPLGAGAKNKAMNSGPFDWSAVIEAIILVESEGNPKAVGGNSVGVLQITPIAVRECNYILKSRGSKKSYTLADRFDVTKSKEMFLLIQSKYNPSNDIEKAIRLWNGGPNYCLRATDRYYKKVLRRMK